MPSEYGLAKAGNNCFIARSPENNTRSPSMNIAVSPRVCVGPSQVNCTFTPPKSIE